MILSDELYFNINVEGTKSNISKFVTFITSGELDSFFEISDEYIMYNDDLGEESASPLASFTLSNDDYGIEIGSFNPERFLDVFCSAGAELYIHGQFFDINDEEYNFVSKAGSISYINTEDIEYSDELDEEARKERDEEKYY